MQIQKFQSNHDQVDTLAIKIAEKLQEVITKKGKATLAVSGGKSPITLFEKLSKAAIDWSKVTITLVDERFTAVDHEDSNENLVRKHLLINNAEQAYFIGLVTTRNILTSVSNANLKIDNIDVAVLGMGEDGHTASIFPCCDELDTALDTKLTTEKYLITRPKNANYERIGLSLSGILEVANVYISISCEKKLSIIESAMLAPTKQYPISYVIASHCNLQILWNA